MDSYHNSGLSLEESAKLPTKDDQVIKAYLPLNCREASNRNAYIDETQVDWYEYREGYKEAADITVYQATQYGESLDILIFPIVYLYRHYIELSLKYLLKVTYKHLGDNNSFRDIHNIESLWSSLFPLITQLNTIFDADAIDLYGQLILEVHKLDPLSTVFRFPVTTKKQGRKPSIDLKPENRILIDVKNVRNMVEKISYFFHFLLPEDIHRNSILA